MVTLDKLVRRLEPRNILIAGALATLAILALVIFVLAPLAFTLLLPAGEAAASIASLVVSIGGSAWTLLSVPKFFLNAHWGRKYDEAVERLLEAFAQNKENGA